ncbi:MAG: hypothetical protein U0797_01955 [Gemmataceae bacterium]
MKYDPTGTGAAPDDLLVRRGKMWESATRLAKACARAAQGGSAVNGVPYGHGVSVTSQEANQVLARDPSDAVAAMRTAFEGAGFEGRYTPTRADDDHHTVVLPEPVTKDVADLFNAILGRSP